jgi:hypothetical protein
MRLSISDTQHNNTMPCADSRYAECHVLFIIMLSVIMLSVVMLSVDMLNVVILSVVAPFIVQAAPVGDAITHRLHFHRQYNSPTWTTHRHRVRRQLTDDNSSPMTTHRQL